MLHLGADGDQAQIDIDARLTGVLSNQRISLQRDPSWIEYNDLISLLPKGRDGDAKHWIGRAVALTWAPRFFSIAGHRVTVKAAVTQSLC